MVVFKGGMLDGEVRKNVEGLIYYVYYYDHAGFLNCQVYRRVPVRRGRGTFLKCYNINNPEKVFVFYGDGDYLSHYDWNIPKEPYEFGRWYKDEFKYSKTLYSHSNGEDWDSSKRIKEEESVV